MDHISGLPDELLHGILVRLRSARAAARTSLLSHRWRRVWAELPELVLGSDDPQPPASLATSIDAAIAVYTAAAVERLEIAMPRDIRVSARRIAPWLRFASQRLVGTLDLRVQCQDPSKPKCFRPEEEQEVELPVCRKATRITLFLGQERYSPLGLERCLLSCLRPAAGSFAALTYLAIHHTIMEARALDALVSLQCPRLENLELYITLVAASDVSLRSDSLISLSYHAANTRRLQIVAPRMEKLRISRDIEAHTISAPKLAEYWVDGARVVCYPCRYDQLVETERSIRLLEVGTLTPSSVLPMFDKVDKLELHFSIYVRQVGGGNCFVVDETTKLPRCETLRVLWTSYGQYDAGFTPTMLHILRKCNGIKKCTVKFRHSGYRRRERPSKPLKTSNITLDSLEEVEIDWDSGLFQEIELFVKYLSKCSTTLLEKVVINCTSPDTTTPTKEACEGLNNMCSPNFIVEFID